MIHPTYIPVFVNLAITGAVCLFFVVYFCLLKRKLHPALLLLLLALLPLGSLLRPGIYESGDFAINIYKGMDFYNSLIHGIWFPRWAAELNGTYGYPLFNFTYPLPYYGIALFHALHLSFITSLKLLLGVSFVAAGFAMYMWMKEELGIKAAIVASIFYLYAPYHLVDVNFRISLGEVLSFIVVPLSLLCIQKLCTKYSIVWLLSTAAVVVSLMLCNQAIALFVVPLLLIYSGFVAYKQKRNVVMTTVRSMGAVGFGLLLSAYYWVPVLVESKFTHQASYVATIEYVSLRQLIYSPWRYGLLFQGHAGELSFVIGYVQLFVIGICLFMIGQKVVVRKDKLSILFFLGLIFSLMFLMLPISRPIWDTFSLLRNFQFTYRLLLLVAVATSFLAGIASMYLRKSVVILMCSVAIVSTILNWGNRGTVPTVTDQMLRNGLPLSTTRSGEGFQPAVPVWVDVDHPWQDQVPAQHVEVVRGSAQVREVERTPIEHVYSVDVTSPSLFKEATVYFPNWEVWANGKIIPIDYNNGAAPGVIFFELPKGTYSVRVVFLPTWDRKVSGWVSFGSLIVLEALCVWRVYSQGRRRVH